jgi:hypothetical protein
MMFPTWAFTNASAIGTSHQRRGEECQDSSLVVAPRGCPEHLGNPIIAAVADGAGTARYAADGSSTAIRVLKEEICRILTSPSGVLTESGLKSAVLMAANHVDGLALQRGHASREYASTLICVVLMHDHAWHIQVGDGAAVFGYGENRVVSYWPAKGEYGNETFFITDENFQKQLHIHRLDQLPDDVTLFTDGLEGIALNLATQEAHLPFYESFYRVLSQREAGYQLDLENHLKEWLQSDLVNSRTDDDKSLVLISRTRPSRQSIS